MISMNKWILVKHRLPKDKQLVDVQGKYSVKKGPVIIKGLEYSSGVGFIVNITHWRPHES